jgi:hypothetical protein
MTTDERHNSDATPWVAGVDSRGLTDIHTYIQIHTNAATCPGFQETRLVVTPARSLLCSRAKGAEDDTGLEQFVMDVVNYKPLRTDLITLTYCQYKLFLYIQRCLHLDSLQQATYAYSTIDLNTQNQTVSRFNMLMGDYVNL